MINIDEKKKKVIKIVVSVIVVVLVLWLLVLGPFIKFKRNEKEFIAAAKRYYEINSSLLPTGNRVSKVTLLKLYEKKFVEELYKIPNSTRSCDSEKSFVKVKMEKGEYKYSVYLKCGIFGSGSIDYKGPSITLNGDNPMNIERGEKYVEPGVKSVNDDSDGKIDISKVKIDSSKVNTSKNGVYEVIYKVTDTNKNETVVTRRVIINQDINSVVKKDTKSKGVYTGYSNNNYIKIDGILFRILKENKDGSVKVVSDEPLAYVDYNSVDKWLNDYFYNKLSNNSKKYIVKNAKWCSDSVSNPDGETSCKKYSRSANVGLLSVDEINNSKDGSGNVGVSSNNDAWTSNSNGKKQIYINSDGKYSSASKSKLLAVYPVLNIIKNTNIVSGSGTSTSPYKFSGNGSAKAGTKVNALKTGEYITYSGYVWRIIGYNESGSTKIIMVDNLKDTNDENVETTFGTSKVYNPKNKNSIGYIASNEYEKYISTKKLVTENIKVYDYKNKVSYVSSDNSKLYKARLALPSMFDLYAPSSEINYWYRESIGSKGIAYQNGSVTGIVTSVIVNQYSNNIKVTANINKKVSVVSGDGTSAEPYKLSK